MAKTIPSFLICLSLSSTAFGAALHGELSLQDPSNANRTVGASNAAGIPQGHVLAVVIREARLGRQTAADAEMTVEIRSGGETVSTSSATLDDSGNGRATVVIADHWEGEYHAVVTVAEGFPSPDGITSGQLRSEFRVIEGEPLPEVPFGIPAVMSVIAAGALVVWWNRQTPVAA